MDWKIDAERYLAEVVVAPATAGAQQVWTEARINETRDLAERIAGKFDHKSVHGGDVLLALSTMERWFWHGPEAHLRMADVLRQIGDEETADVLENL